MLSAWRARATRKHPGRHPAAARHRFGTEGYERTTLRAVAADVGVDPALVIRYFGSKQHLFATAAEFTLHLPDLTGLPPSAMADALLARFFAVWEADTTFVALLRAAMTSARAAETMRQVFATQVAPARRRRRAGQPRDARGADRITGDRHGDHPLCAGGPGRDGVGPRGTRQMGAADDRRSARGAGAVRSMTGTLTVRYRRLTPLGPQHAEAVFIEPRWARG